MATENGRRVWEWSGHGGLGAVLEPGEYARDPKSGYWFAMSPNGHLADLRLHTVTEHGDGTITVAPSILVSRPPHPDEPQYTYTKSESPRVGVPGIELWHGFLECGIWRECR